MQVAKPGKHYVFRTSLVTVVPSGEITLGNLLLSSIQSSGFPCSFCK